MTQRVAVVLSFIALMVCYASTLREMVDQWLIDQDMAHGFVVPIVVVWIIWREREGWQAIPAKPSRWGLLILAAAAALQVVAVLAAGLFAASVAFLVSIVGLIVFLRGFARLRSWTFPLVLTLFMLPKLAIVYNQATLPLQLLASRMAAGILTFSGIGVIREGNILDVGGHRIEVAEACDGIRYLLPLGFIGVLFAYLVDSKAWMRVVLLAVAAPVAMVANAVRVAAAGASPRLATGGLHTLSGVVLFALSLATLAFVHRFVNAAYRFCRA
jgi:exosortase